MLVITYELTVLSVMLFSLFRFLFEARLPSTGGKLYDPRIADGMIGVIVRCETEEQARRAEETVSSLGAKTPVGSRGGLADGSSLSHGQVDRAGPAVPRRHRLRGDVPPARISASGVAPPGSARGRRARDGRGAGLPRSWTARA